MLTFSEDDSKNQFSPVPPKHPSAEILPVCTGQEGSREEAIGREGGSGERGAVEKRNRNVRKPVLSSESMYVLCISLIKRLHA